MPKFGLPAARIKTQATLAAAPFDHPTPTGLVAHLDPEASRLLPTRGMTMHQATVQGYPSHILLEPNGQGAHWFAIAHGLLPYLTPAPGETITLELDPDPHWSAPTLPADLHLTLQNDPEAETLWRVLTPAARWDWIRWANAARLPETRQRRVLSVPSRLKSGKKRPCCFDRNQCTLTNT